jgi:L-ascorbate metabolism protein UlaG (beta-lactamase superfamily)
MLEPLKHAGELARARATRRSSARADGQSLAELEARSLDLPPGLEVEWLGVSGYRLTCEGHTIFIDPYLSRVPFRDLVLRRQAIPDPAALDRFVRAPGEVVGVLVGHTHFDHAVDAPAIARRFGCKAYGSESLVNLMALHGLADRTVEVEPYRTYELGPFEVSFTPSVHSKLLLGLSVPYDGELTCEHLDSLCPSAYRCGQVWGISIAVAGIRFYHQGSANLIDDAVRERGVDVFLAGVAGRSFTRDYWRRILPRLQPRAVVPTHYDNFFRPLGQHMEFVANVQLSSLPDEIGAVSREIELAALPRTDLGSEP